MMNLQWAATLLLLFNWIFFVGSVDAADGTEKPDKSQYSLFHPTPKSLMREFNTDRPDKTESPFTVDAGHFQLEADIALYDKERFEDGLLSRLWRFGTLNLKIGLLNDLDAQVIVPTYNILASGPDGKTYRGYSDTIFRVKWALFGNDGGPIAFAVMPFVAFPTASEGLGDRRVNGGVIFPIALSLPQGWKSGLMFVYVRSRSAEDEAYYSNLISSWAVSHDIVKDLEGYAEIYSRSIDKSGPSWIATFDFGWVYSVSPDLKLDSGVNLGLTPAADDINPFVGISFRLP
jgi:hypothetical protein